MSRHIACLTFDFDAMTGFTARGQMSPTPVSRGEFGAVGAQRLVDLLAKYGLRASFFVPGIVLRTYPEVSGRIAEAGHEIGHHGWSHIPPANLSREEEEEGLVRGNEAIEALTGRKARGYRSPSWDLSPHTIGLLLAHDFVYDSSMMGHDHLPYRARTGDIVTVDEPMVFGRETRLIEMPISWSLDDYPHFEYVRIGNSVAPGLRDTGSVLTNWIDDFLYMKETCDWGVLTYTCHPYVIGRGHRIMMLERLIRRLLDEGAVFMTMEEAADEYAARG
ncbi:peptidoglycan/xylan/chitin deacetylase (PgdA/CDA1 family) [Constrictibacter sp. MBR-5]|jgi:peptidoglycan/xylan/chitin deacetylase (PgdA/CDA1 family)|uniref:polysaccharide deacetylase family protein n=1 Tax=Constrictibacter sp. MBR-5 TaxID=3156467 RepID=UPI0033932E5B